MTGPDTKFKIMHRGEWRPVLHMVAANGLPTPNPLQVAAVVVWMEDGEREVVRDINASDIIAREDRHRQESRWYQIEE